MKVKLALQAFSHLVAVAMYTYIDFNVLSKQASQTANLISKINDLFDLLNTSNLQNFQLFMATKQKMLLQEMDNLFQNIKVLTFDGKKVTKKLQVYFWMAAYN